MAIAGIVLTLVDAGMDSSLAVLRSWPGVCEVQEAGGGKLALVLEISSQDIQQTLEDLSSLEMVLQLDVAYVNYEDDLDSQGHMACPMRQSDK